MSNPFTALFDKAADKRLKDRAAELLKTDPSALERFELAYQAIDQDASPRDAGARARDKAGIPENFDVQSAERLVARIVKELTPQTELLAISGGRTQAKALPGNPDENGMTTNADLAAVPEAFRPQLAGNLVKKDMAVPSYLTLLDRYADMTRSKNPQKRMTAYHMFRQGLDILDLDPVVYEMLGMNQNSMSHWLPQISHAAALHGFFKIPETKIAKVPLPILQLARLDYQELTPTTLKIVDDWAFEAFGLDVSKSYFIKTGTYSSKFDFRNCKVTGEKEVRELGEYLLYINFQANQMASPLNQPCIYGVSTTNEWVVREFIEDKENNPCIYHGLPLHTEYRCFVDFDTGELLAVAPYWEPQTMKRRFAGMDDAASVHNRHDYVIYKAHEDVLMARFEANKDRVGRELQKLLPDTALTGQWSVDVMQNGDDFWIIDMATADTSALSQFVPAGKLRKSPENWLPESILALAAENEEAQT